MQKEEFIWLLGSNYDAVERFSETKRIVNKSAVMEIAETIYDLKTEISEISVLELGASPKGCCFLSVTHTGEKEAVRYCKCSLSDGDSTTERKLAAKICQHKLNQDSILVLADIFLITADFAQTVIRPSDNNGTMVLNF